MLWHFNSTTKSPPNIFISENSSKACPVISPPTASLLTPLSPLLITKDMVIITGGRQRAKGGRVFADMGKYVKYKRRETSSKFPPWWRAFLGYNCEVCYRHLVDSSVGRRVWFWRFECISPFQRELSFCLQALLALLVDRLSGGVGGFLRVAAGSRGSTLQRLSFLSYI